MFHFQEAITNIKGDALIGYYVKAVDMDDGSVIDIYADESLTAIETVSEVENAAKVDDDGMVDFYIPAGNYHLDIYGTDATTFIRRLEDVEMGLVDGSVTLEKIEDLAANKILGSIAGGAPEEITCTAAGRALLDDADAAAQLTTLGVSAFAQTILDDADAAAVRTTLGISASDALITSIAGLTFGADNFIYGTGSDTAAAGTITSFGRSLVDDADASTARTTLGLGTGDSPQFTAIELGNASDTTLARSSAGNVSIEGNLVYRAGGTDVPITDGGTGASTAGGALTNLGVSAFAQTILDDADAAAVRTTIGAGSTYSGCMVKKSADQTGVNLTSAPAISFDSEVHDVGGWHDTVTNNTRLTVPSGVNYVQCGGQIRLTSLTANEVYSALLAKNGTSVFDGACGQQNSANGTSSPRMSFSSGPIAVTAGDYFEFLVGTASDTSVDITASVTNFWIRALG